MLIYKKILKCFILFYFEYNKYNKIGKKQNNLAHLENSP